MRHHIFEESPLNTYPIAVLIKGSSFNKAEIRNNYVLPLRQAGIPEQDCIAFTLRYNDKDKAPNALIKEYLANLLPALDGLSTKYLYVADANYFKVLAGQAKADKHYGYVLPCAIDGFEHMNVVLGLNYRQLIYNPALEPRLEMTRNALASHVQGNYQQLGQNIIHSAHYPKTLDEIKAALDSLHQYPALTCDTETFSLRFNEAGIGTIGFAWDQHNGIAFACDYAETRRDGIRDEDGPKDHGYYQKNKAVRGLLLAFFLSYKGELVFHGAPFDLKVLIYNLFMDDLLDQKGLLDGLDCLTARFQDTMVITYLATNSTAGNKLGLKDQAHEFAGNWAVEEIKDIRKVPLPELLQYNLVDCLSTWFTRNKNYPIMVADQQEELYYSLMLPSQKLITQMELTGMPLNPDKVREVKARLQQVQADQIPFIRGHPLIAALEDAMTQAAWEKDYEDRRKKAKNPDKIFPKDRQHFPRSVFNPGSPVQLQKLLYDLMGLPVLDYTATKQPAAGEDTLKKLVNHTTDPATIAFLNAMIEFSQAGTILEVFIPAFEKAIDKGDASGIVWLHGNFKLGGTVSGRLSSNSPNLQNIPANSKYGEWVKECFMAPKGWLFCGADFNSLEDMISALTTKDPNKLAVYERGFDGHSLRACYYFKDELAAEGLVIDLTDPKSVNQLKALDHPLRQDSKAPTFLLTYGGTYHGMMSNLGWEMEKAKVIEANYHELYKVSDEYVAEKLKQASKDGYVTVAFGLRLRTPLLGQVVFGSRNMPYEAASEGRTAGNALGQSYGLLNNRAAVEFFRRVWASKYRYDILPIALIHDAIYILIRDDIEVVEWANRELIDCMKWQDLPDIQHPTVKLGAALDIMWPSWNNKITLPNDATQEQIQEVCRKAQEKYEKEVA